MEYINTSSSDLNTRLHGPSPKRNKVILTADQGAIKALYSVVRSSKLVGQCKDTLNKLGDMHIPLSFRSQERRGG